MINIMAGGGSTLTLPTLIFLGLDSSMANGTNRVAIFIQNISAIASFRKENHSEFGLSWKLGLLTLPGAVIGAFVATEISNETFKSILAVIMIGVVISMLLPKSKKKFSEKVFEKLPWAIYPAMILIGFYGGFIQVGVGFLLMAALHYIMKMNLVFVNMHKVAIVFLYTIPALLIFIFTNNIDWFYGLSLAAGNALGGWWAAKWAVRKGEKFIRYFLVVVVIGMSLKLLNIF
ncbi:MAG: sulfite exporter TauE/SafE family protein [Melioribacteraceae bacterium]|nr:sulfite exporter TauE/SafE family protein [Melioribacteraceae bacterium]